MTAESTPDQAFESSLDKRKLLASMRHELRTLINHILGYSEMLQEEAEDLILFIGTGESLDDLAPFDAKEFVDSLLAPTV